MEKTIEFDDIVAFIYKAMEKEYGINLMPQTIEIRREEEYINKEGSKQVFDCFSFTWNFDNDDLIIYLDKYYVPYLKDDNFYHLTVENPKDIARWNILIEDVKEYVFNKIEYRFNNFFNRVESKPTNIDDLDN